MKKIGLMVFSFLWLVIPQTYAAESLPKHLIRFSSPTGVLFLKENIQRNALKLLEHFTTQKTVTYCGAASAVMVLNALEITAPEDLQHPSYHYFTQENLFNERIKSIITPEAMQRQGIPLSKLTQVFQAWNVKAEAYYANQLTLKKFRELLKKSITNQHFIVVNFNRATLDQEGHGHFSPIAAYNERTDRFLMLDVARYKYPAYWVKTADLWKAVFTQDADRYRGVIIINSSEKAAALRH